MPIGFIIMQIGNEELDHFCETAIVPALESCGLDPKRVDKHNEGGLLKSEIVEFIQQAEIIIADLTNERPNCYLEVGYAMGIDKFRNLILTAREDHLPDRPGREPGDPKVHFDLQGYDLLLWKKEDLEGARDELAKRVRRRQAILAPRAGTRKGSLDEEWLERHRETAREGFDAVGLKGFMEVTFHLLDHPLNKSQQELRDAARQSEIHTFGWPIGVFLGNRPELTPKPTTDGIVAEVPADRTGAATFDYWTLRRNGDFYLLKTIFEDYRGAEDRLFFNTRIVRVTEVLLYAARLYDSLGVPRTAAVHFGICHGGLRDRYLSASSPGRALFREYGAVEDSVYTEITTTLEKIESELVLLVKELLRPVFVLFDFFELNDAIYEEIVNAFVEGKVA